MRPMCPGCGSGNIIACRDGSSYCRRCGDAWWRNELPDEVGGSVAPTQPHKLKYPPPKGMVPRGGKEALEEVVKRFGLKKGSELKPQVEVVAGEEPQYNHVQPCMCEECNAISKLRKEWAERRKGVS